MAMKRFQDVDSYIDAHPEWSEALSMLRQICSATEMEETVKWGAPHYTINGKNVVGIAAFKNHFALWFHQGVFLKDKHRLLLNAQEGKTRGLRQIRFTSADQIKKRILTSYLKEAIENEKKGLSIKPARSRTKTTSIPEELSLAFQKDLELKAAFDGLTPGRKKEYAEYISEAKRSETRQKRVLKITPMIQEGIGLNDKYR